jgi:hypothetical protein
MLALAAANAVGVVLFGTLYAVAGANLLSQVAFLACLAILFALVVAFWVRTESRHRHLDVLSRVGNAAGGLALVAVTIPTVVLLPLFWLDTQVPAQAGLNPMLAPIMAVVLISLALVAVVNVLGTVVIVVRTLLRGR